MHAAIVITHFLGTESKIQCRRKGLCMPSLWQHCAHKYCMRVHDVLIARLEQICQISDWQLIECACSFCRKFTWLWRPQPHGGPIKHRCDCRAIQCSFYN